MLDEHVRTRIDDAHVAVVLPANAVVRGREGSQHLEDLGVARGLALVVRTHNQPIPSGRRLVVVSWCHGESSLVGVNRRRRSRYPHRCVPLTWIGVPPDAQERIDGSQTGHGSGFCVETCRVSRLGTLDGQVGLVTGGGGGIGASIAVELASAGMRVVVAGRTRARVEEVARRVEGLALVGDVSLPADVDRWFVEATTSLGPIDLLVNNAAVLGAPEPFWAHDADEWWRVFEINLRGPQLCCRAALPTMIEHRRGRIINLTSGAAYLADLPANARDTSYPASKAALARFTELLAAQVAEHGVLAFAVSPGLVHSEMTSELADDSPWTPPDAPPRLIRGIAEGKADALSGRYLHAEHDADLDALAARGAEIRERDLNAIRLRR